MTRRVPLLEAYRAAGAQTGEVYGTTTGLTLAPTGRGLWLADLTLLPKWLLVGGSAASAMREAGMAVPALLRVLPGADAGFGACRAPRQYLVSAADATVPPPTLLNAACALRHDCADFALGGGSGENGVAALLAEASPTPREDRAPGALIPTLCFGVEAALWRCGPDAWRVLAAPADGDFLSAVLLDAVRERHGALTGYRDFLGMPHAGAT